MHTIFIKNKQGKITKILAVEWRSARDTVGVVLIQNAVGQKSARIGTVQTIELPSIGKIHVGNETTDARYIADHGAKLSFQEAVGFFPWLKEEEYKKT